jgi:F-box protein 2
MRWTWILAGVLPLFACDEVSNETFDGATQEWADVDFDGDLLPAPYDENLLVNPGGEDGDMTGWRIMDAGGDGWAVAGDLAAASDAGGTHSGDHEFRTSYDRCRRDQVIDLLAAGFTEDELDAAPPVHAQEWFASYCHGPDTGLLRVRLLDENRRPITGGERELEGLGSVDCYTDDAWRLASNTFTDYGPGLRYVTFEDGGQDGEFWGGHYGIRFDDAWLSIDTP